MASVKKVGNFWWPQEDRDCAPAVLKEAGPSIERIVGHLPIDRRRVAVQAGGNVGVWPILMAQYFHRIFSYEPCRENFLCMEQNIADSGRDNIHTMNVGLHAGFMNLRLKKQRRNVGAHAIDDNGTENIKVLPLDSFKFHCLDLIVLDIEGCEGMALCGAEATINEHKPLIVIEDKGLDMGVSAVDTLTEELGYEHVDSIFNDKIFRRA